MDPDLPDYIDPDYIETERVVRYLLATEAADNVPFGDMTQDEKGQAFECVQYRYARLAALAGLVGEV